MYVDFMKDYQQIALFQPNCLYCFMSSKNIQVYLFANIPAASYFSCLYLLNLFDLKISLIYDELFQIYLSWIQIDLLLLESPKSREQYQYNIKEYLLV